MKKRIIAILSCLIFIFSFTVFSENSENSEKIQSGVTDETKKELLRYILYSSQADSKEKIDYEEVFLDTLMKYAENSDEDFNKLLRNFLESLDEYGEYYSPDEIDELNADLTSVSGGIGATVEMRNGSFNIVNVLPGSGAEKAGVEAGWQIIEVDGVSMEGISLYKALTYVRGEIDTEVTIKFLNNSHEEIILTITRCQIDIDTLAYQMLKETKHKIGYITIDSFQLQRVQNCVKLFPI